MIEISIKPLPTVLSLPGKHDDVQNRTSCSNVLLTLILLIGTRLRKAVRYKLPFSNFVVGFTFILRNFDLNYVALYFKTKLSKAI